MLWGVFWVAGRAVAKEGTVPGLWELLTRAVHGVGCVQWVDWEFWAHLQCALTSFILQGRLCYPMFGVGVWDPGCSLSPEVGRLLLPCPPWLSCAVERSTGVFLGSLLCCTFPVWTSLSAVNCFYDLSLASLCLLRVSSVLSLIHTSELLNIFAQSFCHPPMQALILVLFDRCLRTGTTWVLYSFFIATLFPA
jgi:hypothetical protein